MFFLAPLLRGELWISCSMLSTQQSLVDALATHESLYWPLYAAKRFIWSRLRTALLYGFKRIFKKQLGDMFNQQDKCSRFTTSVDELFSYRPDEGPQCWAGTLSSRSGLRNNWLPRKSHVTIIAIGTSYLANCYCSKPGKTISDFFSQLLLVTSKAMKASQKRGASSSVLVWFLWILQPKDVICSAIVLPSHFGEKSTTMSITYMVPGSPELSRSTTSREMPWTWH